MTEEEMLQLQHSYANIQAIKVYLKKKIEELDEEQHYIKSLMDKELQDPI